MTPRRCDDDGADEFRPARRAPLVARPCPACHDSGPTHGPDDADIRCPCRRDPSPARLPLPHPSTGEI
jgi:hypothetical protein